MEPLKNFKPEKVRYIFTDLDDTLTTDGILSANVYASLWQLRQAQIKTIIITGRPAGWCDLMARQWPVDSVIGENGAFYYRLLQNKMSRIQAVPSSQAIALAKKRKSLANKLKRKFPSIRWAADQDFRQTDLAIDICEDIPPVSKRKVQQILEFCRS